MFVKLILVSYVKSAFVKLSLVMQEKEATTWSKNSAKKLSSYSERKIVNWYSQGPVLWFLKYFRQKQMPKNWRFLHKILLVKWISHIIFIKDENWRKSPKIVIIALVPSRPLHSRKLYQFVNAGFQVLEIGLYFLQSVQWRHYVKKSFLVKKSRGTKYLQGI
jgi:hypothetical protein